MEHWGHKLVWWLIIMGSCPMGYSTNQIKLKRLSIEEGLPGVSVQSVFQDSKGLMWFGIEANGACMYDGRNFTQFQHNSSDSTSISDNYVTAISEDLDGNIWMGTLNGLNKLNRSTYQFQRYYHTPDNPFSICHNQINCLTMDSFGNLWIGTNNGISIYDPSHNHFFNLLHDPSQNINKLTNITISSIVEDQAHHMWIGSSHYGLFFFASYEVKAYLIKAKAPGFKMEINGLLPQKLFRHDKNNPDGLIDDMIRSMCLDNSGNLWIGTQVGLQYFHIETEKFQTWHLYNPESQFLSGAAFSSLLMDKNGWLWTGTTNSGLLVIDTKNIQKIEYLSTFINPGGQLKSNSIRALCEDHSGLIWIGTKFEGLYIYDKRQLTFQHIPQKDGYNPGLNDSYVMSLLEGKDGAIWIGTKNGGLNQYDIQNQRFSVFHCNQTYQNTKLSNRIQCLLPASDHEIWIGTDQHLELFNTQTHQIVPYHSRQAKSVKCTMSINYKQYYF